MITISIIVGVVAVMYESYWFMKHLVHVQLEYPGYTMYHGPLFRLIYWWFSVMERSAIINNQYRISINLDASWFPKSLEFMSYAQDVGALERRKNNREFLGHLWYKVHTVVYKGYKVIIFQPWATEKDIRSFIFLFKGANPFQKWMFLAAFWWKLITL